MASFVLLNSLNFSTNSFQFIPFPMSFHIFQRVSPFLTVYSLYHMGFVTMLADRMGNLASFICISKTSLGLSNSWFPSVIASSPIILSAVMSGTAFKRSDSGTPVLTSPACRRRTSPPSFWTSCLICLTSVAMAANPPIPGLCHSLNAQAWPCVSFIWRMVSCVENAKSAKTNAKTTKSFFINNTSSHLYLLLTPDAPSPNGHH